MSISRIIKEYIISIKNEYASAVKSNTYTPELSYRPVVDTFFRNIVKEIDENIATVFEPSSQGVYGRPDWRFHNTENYGVYGYIEGKKLQLDRQLEIADYQEQIDKYLLLKHNLILTDGIDFIFIYSDTDTKYLSLVNKNSWSNTKDLLLIENEFHRFFSKPCSRVVSETQLIEDIARRAIPLNENIYRLCNLSEHIANESEIGLLTELNKLKYMLSKYSDDNLSKLENFSDYITQVLLFGLIYSHRTTYERADKPQKRFNKIQGFLEELFHSEFTNTVLPFKGIVSQLKSELNNELGLIGTWYQDALLYLSYVDLTKEQVTLPDYHSLFEKFLGIYKPSIKFDYGAFYTPRIITSYIVRFVDEILNSSISSESEFTVIDPCCGTGSFIEEIITSNGNISKNADKIVGIEILPAPYALANYRIAMLKEDTEKIRILLSDTLNDYLEGEVPQSLIHDCYDFIVKEIEEAYYCANDRIEIILCNPPVSDSFDYRGKNHKKINYLMEDFRPPQKLRTSRSNVQKQVRNSFMYFLRWSIEKLKDKEKGVLALILPDTFIENISYKYARKYLCLCFDDLWCIKFDSDKRANKGSQNVFKTLQGRIIIIAEKGLGKKKDMLSYLDISDFSYNKKYEFFKCSNITDFENDGVAIQLTKNDFSLDLKQALYEEYTEPNINKEYYTKCWKITDNNETEKSIFQRSCSGIKLGATGLYVNADKRILLRRFFDMFTAANMDQKIIEIFGEQSSPKKTNIDKVKTIFGFLSDTDYDKRDVTKYPVFKYSYRPFVSAQVFLDTKLMKKMQSQSGGGTRSRPEIINLFSSEKETVKFICSKNIKEQDSILGRFTSFAWELPDNDLTRRGNAVVLSSGFSDYSTGEEKSYINNNINRKLITYIKDKVTGKDVNFENIITYYCYAVLCSDYYMERYEHQLYSMNISVKDIRIPIFDDLNVIMQLSNYGMKIARCEKDEYKPTININSTIPIEDIENFKLEKAKYKSDISILTLSGVNSHVNVYIPNDVYELKICGYQVIKKWLELRMYKNLHREITRSDLRAFFNLVDRIKEQINLISEIDGFIEQAFLHIPLLTVDIE